MDKDDEERVGTGDAGASGAIPKKRAGTSPRLKFGDWESVKKEIVDEVRRSEKLTESDLAIRINTRG
jgi:hypothetical protein